MVRPTRPLPPFTRPPIVVAGPPERTAYRELESKVPIALLPVRLEARYFAVVGNTDEVELRVRIFPDALHLHAPRVGLSTFEAEAGRAYREARGSEGADSDAGQRAWVRLVESVGSVRASYVVRSTAPGAQPGTLDESRPTTAVALPNRWAVCLVQGGTTQRIAWSQPVAAELPVEPPADGSEVAPEWVANFAAAEAAGMAVSLRLPRPLADTLDALVVIGVREGASAADGAAELTRLLEAHTVGTGAAFLPLGTPTNHTDETRVSTGALTDEELGLGRLTLAAAETGAPSPSSNGGQAARALGLVPEVFRWLPHAHGSWDAPAAAAATALWPVTWGYYLEQLMRPLFDDAGIAWARRHFIEHVRARGPLPTWRVGRQPYGILPILPLDAWKPATGAVETADARLIAALRVLRDQWRAGLASVPRVDGVGDPGQDLEDVLSVSPIGVRRFGRTIEGRQTARARRTRWDVFNHFDEVFEALHSRLATQALAPLGLTGVPHLAGLIFDDDEFLVDAPVAAAGANPRAPLAVNYIEAIAQAAATADVEKLQSHGVTGAAPRTLLYMLLRHATLLALARAGDATQNVPKDDRLDLEFIPQTRVNTMARLVRPVGAVGHDLAGRLRADLVLVDGSAGTAGTASPTSVIELGEHRQALDVLKGQPVEELERLTAETLDLASHRLDAWITSFATKRLAHLRTQAPSGVYLGGYGWLEQPRPSPTLAQDGVLRDDPRNQGYLHAPSLAQARTAAVLRAGYLAHRGDAAGSSLAIDLSSARVQRAQWLLDGVQQGSSFAALLGYRVERGLIERQRGARIAELRAAFPLALTVDGRAEGAAGIDGVRLHEAWQARPPADDLREIAAELHELVDAAADLLVAESTHQLLRGDGARARAALEALETFERPLDRLDVVRTPVDAVRSLWRVGLSVPANLPGWPGDAERYRAQAEPTLNGFAAALLGDARQLAFDVRGTSGDVVTARRLTVAELDLCALDVVDLAREVEGTTQVDALVLAHARGLMPSAERLEVSPTEDALSSLYVARALRRLFGAARPLVAADLLAQPVEAAEAPASPALERRARDLIAALRRDEGLVATDARARARAAALAGAETFVAADAAHLLTEALRARREAAEAQPDARAKLRAIVGRELPLVESVTWPSLGFEDDEAAGLADGRASSWLHDLARVRTSMESLDEVLLLAEPAVAGETRAYALGDGARLVLAGAKPSGTVTGLYVDGWSEVRPLGTATTAAALHYDAPNARPPQTVLLAVPPDPDAGWSFASLLASVTDALELAKLRLVAPGQVAGQYLPATVLAENLEHQTVTTTLYEIGTKVLYTLE